MNSMNEQELRALMRDVENNTINKTDWLKRSEVEEIIKKHQARTAGTITIADILVSRGFIDLRHRDYGMDFLELRKAVYGKLDAKTSNMLSLGDTSLKKSNAARIFELITKGMGREAEHFIGAALNTQYNDSIKHVFVANVYRIAFETLETEIDLALAKIAQEAIQEEKHKKTVATT